MNRFWRLLPIALSVGAFVGAGALILALVVPQSVTAQGEPWNSSAEPPAGTTLAPLSLPDAVGVNGPDNPDSVDGVSLVSWRVTGSALKPRANNVSYSVNANGSCVYVTAGSAATVWNVPINLPNGAVVDTLRMYYYDTSASNTSAWFTIYDLYGTIVQEWSVTSSGNFGNSFNDSAQISHTIDYAVYSYVLNWRPVIGDSTIQLCGFRVFYQPPPFGLNFLPTIAR